MGFDRVELNRTNQAFRGLEAAQERAVAHPDSQASPKKARPDSLSLSDRAQEIRVARKAVQASPDVRADRVAELQRRITAGTYYVPAETLAHDLLKSS